MYDKIKKWYKKFISILIEDYLSHKMVHYTEVAIINKGNTFPRCIFLIDNIKCERMTIAVNKMLHLSLSPATCFHYNLISFIF